MTEIIPAIMPKNYDDLVEKMGLFAGVVPLIQLDIMDNKFVKARTWPYNPGDSQFDRFAKIIAEEEGMPEWDTLDFEVDLMIENPEAEVSKWITAGASRIIVHVEGMKDFETIRASVPEGMIELGLAINTTTPLSAVEPYLDRIDFVQCMGIAQIGFQGQPFDERVLDHVRAIRALRPQMPISIDGAVSPDTAKRLVEVGATRLVSGSAILKSADVSNAIEMMRDLVQ
jgi:ribulose-phosphate 3-epimerase